MGNNGSKLAVYENATTQLLTAEMTDQVKETVRKLMRLAPGGNRLNANEATDLAIYSLMNDLNPYNGEAYYLPGVGPLAGVAGYRRKANEWLLVSYGPTARFWCEFEDAPMGSGDFDPEAGDIAYICTLHDSISKREWESSTLGAYAQLRQGGMESDEAWKEAKNFVGSEPVWTAVGVVDHREHFAKEGKPDKWDRHERAKKRAEKWAIRKRFPSTIIPDNDLDFDIIDSVATEIGDELNKPRRSASTIIEELGYGPSLEKLDNAEKEFQSITEKLRWSKEEAQSVLKEARGDFEKALELAKKQLPPE